ncbi:MAG TPA: hypothetical protein VK821_18970 [Dehalococcoidia bacterium]|nr:hypothetical protein [Dehalococcoidia bacterium]
MALVLTDWLQLATARGALLSGFGLLGTMAIVLIPKYPEIYFALTDPALTVEHWDLNEQMRL